MKTNSPNQSRFLIAFLALAGVASLLWAVNHYTGVVVHPYVLLVVRWATIVALCGYAFFRRSLTPWIFAGMLVGVEIGYHISFFAAEPRERVAADLQVLSAVFLRLDQNHHCAPDFRHPGGGHCRTLQSQAGWTHGNKSPAVF